MSILFVVFLIRLLFTGEICLSVKLLYEAEEWRQRNNWLDPFRDSFLCLLVCLLGNEMKNKIKIL